MGKIEKHFTAVSLSDLAEMRQFIEETSLMFGANEDAVSEMVVAANEAITNVLIHGYKKQPGSIDLHISYNAQTLIVAILDNAPPFDPTAVPSPDINAPLEQRRPGGLGVHMIREFTDQVSYRFTPQSQNELRLMIK